MIAAVALTALPLTALAAPQPVQQQNPDQPPTTPGQQLNAKGQPMQQQPVQQPQPQTQSSQQQQTTLPATAVQNRGTMTARMHTPVKHVTVAAKNHRTTAKHRTAAARHTSKTQRPPG